MPKERRPRRVSASVSATQVRSSRQKRGGRTLNIPNDHGNPATSEQTMSLIKDGNNIRKLSVDHGFQAAKLYDEEFRKLIYVHRLEWTTVHDELWWLAMGQSRNSNNNSYAQAFLLKKNKTPFLGRTQQQPSGYTKGYC